MEPWPAKSGQSRPQRHSLQSPVFWLVSGMKSRNHEDDEPIAMKLQLQQSI